MTMRRVLFLDLDDTIFHSRRKRSPGRGAEPVALASDGTPDSFMSDRQQAFFDWIIDGAEVVPTTGRNVAAYRRVELPFAGWTICSFGGVVLRPDGTSDPRWRERIAPLASAADEFLHALVENTLAASGDRPVRARVIDDDGLPLYISVKSEHAGLDDLAATLRSGLPSGWRVHVNANNLAILPAFLGKEHAVRWFIETIAGPDALLIGAGDSISDAPFLAACDYALTPSDSQIIARLLESL